MEKLVRPEVQSAYRELKPLMDETDHAAASMTRALYKTLHKLPPTERVYTLPLRERMASVRRGRKKARTVFLGACTVVRHVGGPEAPDNIPSHLGGRGKLSLNDYWKRYASQRPLAGYANLFVVAVALEHNRRYIDNHIIPKGPLPKLPGYNRVVDLELYNPNPRWARQTLHVDTQTRSDLANPANRFLERYTDEDRASFTGNTTAAYTDVIARTLVVAEGARMLHDVTVPDQGLPSLHRDWQNVYDLNFDSSLPVHALTTQGDLSYHSLNNATSTKGYL